MRIAYLLLVHKDPEQVRRLVKRLHTRETEFFVHVDRRSDIHSFTSRLENLDCVEFLNESERVASVWGDFGIVNASLNLLRAAHANSEFQWFILLSGQDYPIVTNQCISQRLRSTEATVFMNCHLASDGWSEPVWRERAYHYKFTVGTNRGDHISIPSIWVKEFYTSATIRKIKLLCRRKQYSSLCMLLRRKKWPFSTADIHGGSAWWALARTAAQSLLDFASADTKIRKYFEFTLFPDELYFQNCLLILKQSNPDINIAPSLTYVNWSRPNVPLPVTFTFKDRMELQNAKHKYLFARKFSSDESESILEWLDAR